MKKRRRMAALLLALLIVCSSSASVLAAPVTGDKTVREKISFNTGWTFRRIGPNHATLPQKITLPHDAMLQDGRDPSSPSGSAGAWYVPGIYQYEKKFEVPENWKNRHAVIHFGGVYKNTKVYVNGRLAEERPYGYSPFSVNLDPYLRYGFQNKIRVIADNSKQPNSRWYSGAGIYRPVSLIVTDKQRIAENGIKISTERTAPAVIRVQTKCENAEGCIPVVSIYDGSKEVVEAKGADVRLQIPHAKLWDAEHPYLYTAKVRLQKGAKTVDQDSTAFGIRMISWSKDGFFVNGRSTLLRGGCIHSDNGILGAVSTQEAEDRKIQILKENGYNAIRSAHNTASEELLRACDKYGMYVMDEAFDMWYHAKNKYDYSLDFAQWHEKDLHSMIEKDYDHPSVILYSIGNEVTEPAEEKGIETARELTAQCHREDPSRPVTAGINLLVLLNAKLTGSAKTSASNDGSGSSVDLGQISGSTLYNTVVTNIGTGMTAASSLAIVDKVVTPVFDELDIAGYNYGSGRYDRDPVQHPNRIMLGTETYPSSIYDNWSRVEKYPQLIGDFMWSGMDYLGEVAVGAWNYEGTNMMNAAYPWKLAENGAVDLCGHATGEAAYAATVWHLRDKPYIGVQPCNHPGETLSKAAWRWTNAIDSWSWAGCQGNDVTVEIYSDKGSYAELYLNGKKISRAELKKDKCSIQTRYEPGTLTAKVFSADGKEVGENQLTSAAGPVHVSIIPEKKKVRPGQMLYLDINLLGANGIVESNADRTLTVKVDHGELLGFGSARPKTEDSFTSGRYSTYYGRALAAVRVGAKAHKVTITVTEVQTGKKTKLTIPV